MNLIIPMAGKGKRLRPHTLTTAKPLIPIAGKPIVQRLVEDISKVLPEPIQRIAFVVGDFGEEVEQNLIKIAEGVGAKASILPQGEALGTAHAVHIAKDHLQGKVMVAFSDTLFKADFKLDTSDDGIIWVKQVADPSAYGVVKPDQDGIIEAFLEKPKEPISDLAIIGIYYFREGEKLRKALDHLIDNQIMVGGEYQLTTALEDLKNDGVKFTTGQVSEWLDCGNKEVTVASNIKYMELMKANEVHDSANITNSTIIPPVVISSNVKVSNSVIGPGVSIGADSVISGCIINDSLIQNNVHLFGVHLTNSMLGNYVKMKAVPNDVSLGDFTEWKG